MVKFSLRSSLNLNAINIRTQKASQARLKVAGLAVEREAKESMRRGGGKRPVKRSGPGEPPNVQTGTLRNSIKTEQAGPLTVIVGPSVHYGKYLEFGTRRMAPRPFMRPALRAVKNKLPQLFRRLW